MLSMSMLKLNSQKSIISELQCSLEDGVLYRGGDIEGSNPIGNVITPKACCDLCKQNTLCKLFSWNKNNQDCWLKHTEHPGEQNADRISGKLGM